MAKGKTVKVKSYSREGHRVKSHTRGNGPTSSASGKKKKGPVVNARKKATGSASGLGEPSYDSAQKKILEKLKAEGKEDHNPPKVTPGDKSHAKLEDGKVHYTGFYGNSNRLRSDGLTGAEADMIAYYTGRGFRDLNPGLRDGKSSDPGVAALNTALYHLPKYQGKVYRGLTNDDPKVQKQLLNDYKASIGKSIEMKAFTSTSVFKSVASDFRGSSHPVQYEIHSKTGRNISNYSWVPEQGEVLFRTNTKFKVKSVNGNVVTLEED